MNPKLKRYLLIGLIALAVIAVAVIAISVGVTSYKSHRTKEGFATSDAYNSDFEFVQSFIKSVTA
jgi:flagellar basal body-associated protein FliL